RKPPRSAEAEEKADGEDQQQPAAVSPALGRCPRQGERPAAKEIGAEAEGDEGERPDDENREERLGELVQERQRAGDGARDAGDDREPTAEPSPTARSSRQGRGLPRRLGARREDPSQSQNARKAEEEAHRQKGAEDLQPLGREAEHESEAGRA